MPERFTDIIFWAQHESKSLKTTKQLQNSNKITTYYR